MSNFRSPFLNLVTGSRGTTWKGVGGVAASLALFVSRYQERTHWTQGYSKATRVPGREVVISLYSLILGKWFTTSMFIATYTEHHKVITSSGWNTRTNTRGNKNTTPMYAAFQFSGSGGRSYGWLELSNPGGAAMELIGYADYPNSGSVPEPSTFALTGLAALALGASGLRRWRAARKPAR